MGGGSNPIFAQDTEIWIWGWAKMGKKVYEKRGKQSFYFENRKIPIFSHGSPKFGFGDGKNVKKWGKKCMEREEKTFVSLTHCWYIVIIIFCILNKIYGVTFCIT